MMKKIICLLIIFVVTIQVYSQELRGVDFTLVDRSVVSELDSALLRRNSTLYSGKSAYGMADSKESIFNKWANNKEKYYPVMKEAWKYCIDRLPYQLRLYRDGILFNQWMVDAAKDSVSRAKYCNEMIDIYDKQIQNLDSINAHVKRVSDKSSKGGIMLQKTYAYASYVLGRNDKNYYDANIKSSMYSMYKEAVDVIKQTYEAGDENGGGGNEGDVGLPYYLTDYFGYAFWHYADTVNAHLTNDSINKQIKDVARNTLLEEYNFIRDFCNRQIQELGADYAADDEAGLSDSINVVLEKVVKPYQDLLNACNTNMQYANINVDVQTLAQAIDMYDSDLESHKDSLAWLNRVKVLCENTTDFSPDNLFYDFYEDVCRYYEAALEKAKQSMSQKQVKKFEGNEYYTRAVPLYNAVVAKARSGKSLDANTIRSGLLAIYYLKQAKRTDPGNAAKYQKQISWLGQIKGEAFFQGFTEGKSITVNGVNFTVSF